MKKRKRLTLQEKKLLAKAVAKAVENGETAIEVTTDKRTYRVVVKDGYAVLPSGKAFEIDPKHMV